MAARFARYATVAVVAALLASQPCAARAQSSGAFVPVTDAMLQDPAPAPADWLMWHRTLDSWGYSPLDQIGRDNVGDLRLVWTRAMTTGSQQGTPLVHDGVVYMPNPRDETWGDVPYEKRTHVGAWMVPSYDPALNLVYIGTSVSSPAPKFMLGSADKRHLYHNSTLALDADTGEIVWYYQHLNDHWDLDHPFERILLDTAVAPDPGVVSGINPRLRAGEVRKVVTGIPGKTGVVYTLDRETGEFLWATPTVTQNVVSHIDGATR